MSDALRRKLLAVMGLSDIRLDEGYREDTHEARAFGEELTARAEGLFHEKTNKEWLAVLDEAGVPAGSVRFPEELLEEEQVVANGMVVELDHHLVGKLKMVGPLVRMSETCPQAKAASPVLGQHTDEILSSLGYSSGGIQRLRELGVTR